MVEATPRKNNTMRETLLWVERYPDDAQLELTAGFVGNVVRSWRLGEISAEQVVREIAAREDSMLDSEDCDSASGAVLAQSQMWFGYEADIVSDDILSPIRDY